jgi:hypothetical protein
MSRAFISFDYALKRLLLDKANYDVLEGFLSELFGYDLKVNNIIVVRNDEDVPDDKYNSIDIVVEDGKGEIMVIELQFNAEINYFHRMLYGTSKIVIDKIKAEQSYDALPKIISINIIYYGFKQGNDYMYHCNIPFKGIHNGDRLLLDRMQRDRYGKEAPEDIYPEFYILKIDTFKDKTKNRFDEWIYFLKNNSIKDEFTAKGMDKARQVLQYENLTPEEKKEYDRIADIHLQNKTMLFTAKDEGKHEMRMEYEQMLAQERKEKEAILADLERKYQEKEAALKSALAELAALKNNK